MKKTRRRTKSRPRLRTKTRRYLRRNGGMMSNLGKIGLQGAKTILKEVGQDQLKKSVTGQDAYSRTKKNTEMATKNAENFAKQFRENIENMENMENMRNIQNIQNIRNNENVRNFMNKLEL